jgi:hypothetical protein
MNIELATVIADAKTRISAIESNLINLDGFVCVHSSEGLTPTGLRSLGGNNWNCAGDEISTKRVSSVSLADKLARSIIGLDLDVMPYSEFVAMQRDALVEMIAFLEKA